MVYLMNSMMSIFAGIANSATSAGTEAEVDYCETRRKAEVTYREALAKAEKAYDNKLAIAVRRYHAARQKEEQSML